jgi:hypothetical protein
MAAIAAITALGGGAPPVAMRTGWPKWTLSRRAASASITVRITGAPHGWLTLFAMSASTRWASNLRTQIWVPPTAVTAQETSSRCNGTSATSKNAIDRGGVEAEIDDVAEGVEIERLGV